MKKSAHIKHLSGLITKFSAARILVVGDLILDKFIWGKVDRISPEAPVPVVQVQRESFMLGGSLNVSSNIRALGAEAVPCGVIGRDTEGKTVLKLMRERRMDGAGLITAPGRPTSIKTRVVAHSQQVVRFDRETTEDVAAADLKKVIRFAEERIPGCDAVILEDYGKGLIQPLLIRKVIELALKQGIPVLVDPKQKHFEQYKGATVITPNRKEANQAYGAEAGLDQVGAGLLKKLGCGAVLITLGEAGMALYEKSRRAVKIPAIKRQVYDVSGAGDTVIAVLALALAAGAPLLQAARLANIAGGLVVAKLGTAMVSPKELREALEAHA